MNPNKNYIGAALVALAFIGAWGWILPEYNKISELNLAIEERNDLYDSRSAIIKKIQELNQEYQARSGDITRIASLLPNKKSLAEAVSAIERISTQSGLQLVNASIIGTPSDRQGDAFESLPIDLTLNGNYRGLVSFLQGIEKNLRIVDVTSIDASATSVERPDLLFFSIRGKAYYLK